MLIKVGDEYEEVTQEYLDKYPYSDEAMYLRFKQEPRGVDPAHDHFIEWFENGKKPPSHLGRYRLFELVTSLKETGMPEQMFLDITDRLANDSLSRLFRNLDCSVSHETAELIIQDIEDKMNGKKRG